APFFSRIILVEAGEVAVVALVERLVAGDDDVDDPELLEDEVERMLGALERGGVVEVGQVPGGLDPPACRTGLGDPLLGEVRVLPASEQVLEVPLAFAMADEDQRTGHLASVMR